MSLEQDTLTAAALKFGEAIRAERTATMDALETERKAALSILEALRKENEKRSQAARGRLFLGFFLGAAIGVIIVLLATPKSGRQNRESITLRIKDALEAGQKAAAVREQELWDEYRKRMQPDPLKQPPDTLYF